jgi:hypothetical protein
MNEHDIEKEENSKMSIVIVNKELFKQRIIDTAFVAGTLITGSVIIFNLLTPHYFSEWKSVTVKSGDTIWGLCQEYCPNAPVSDMVNTVCNDNHIIGSIQPGECIEIPSKYS